MTASLTPAMLALAIDILLVGILVGVFSCAQSLLGPSRRYAGEKAMPYETGMPPLGAAAAHMSVNYHRLAVLFVVFDVDLALLVPWVLMRDRLTMTAMVSISVFLGLVALTLAYVWRRGALEV